MREEIDQVIGSKSDITNEDVCKLNYTSKLLEHTLRLWATSQYIVENLFRELSYK
jgi:hypothetical protein